MVEMINEKLFFTAQQNIISIDKTVEAIEKALEKLLVLRDAEIQLSTAFADDSQRGVEQISADAKIASLRILREELLEEKENNLLLIRGFDRLLHSDGRYPGGHRTFCITVDPLAEQENCCEAAAQRLSEKANKTSAKVISILGDDYMAGDASELLRCVEIYESTSRELIAKCHEAANAFRRTRELYDLCEAAIRTDIDTLLQDRHQKEETLKRSTVPPPVQVSYSMPASPRSRQDEDKMRRKVESHTENKSKKGIFGLFNGKKKKVLNSSEEQVLPPPNIDSVQFSAVAPNRVVPGKYLPINIVMYEDAFRKTVDDIIRSHEEGAKESKSGYQDVERNSLIKVILTSPDVAIEDGEEEQKWTGKYLDFEFAAKIPNDFAEEQILFSATVYINDLIATKLKLILDCERKPKRNVTVTREDVVSAFVSYASQDRSRVAAIIQGMKKARPDMDIFFDIESLRSGQKWEDALKSEISSRDILFLCWSKFARDSKWVDMEWRYALECKGEDFIEPIPIDSPDVCPPPIELQQKHFNDKMLFIIKATMPAEVGHPYLMRIKTNECMTIDKPIVRIGKEEKYVDLMISGNAAVSLNHANIISREGKYYIVDLNSTNRTFVDGQVIPANVEIPIKHGSKIKLANEEFEFVHSSCVYGEL